MEVYLNKEEREHSRIAGMDANEINVAVSAAGRRRNNLRYSDDTAESNEDCVTLLHKF